MQTKILISDYKHILLFIEDHSIDKLVIQFFSQEIQHFPLKDSSLGVKVMSKATWDKFLCSCLLWASMWKISRWLQFAVSLLTSFLTLSQHTHTMNSTGVYSHMPDPWTSIKTDLEKKGVCWYMACIYFK
jgi:hypothetical protein